MFCEKLAAAIAELPEDDPDRATLQAMYDARCGAVANSGGGGHGDPPPDED